MKEAPLIYLTYTSFLGIIGFTEILVLQSSNIFRYMFGLVLSTTYFYMNFLFILNLLETKNRYLMPFYVNKWFALFLNSLGVIGIPNIVYIYNYDLTFDPVLVSNASWALFRFMVGSISTSVYASFTLSVLFS